LQNTPSPTRSNTSKQRRDAPSAARTPSATSKQNLDPFFTQPYQPSGTTVPVKPSLGMGAGIKKTNKPVAALLGGLQRKA